MKKLTLILLLLPLLTHAQKVTTLVSNQKTSLRGLSVVTDNTVWVSGSNGQVGRSLDGGNTWKWMTVKGYEKRDFRDIEAFDEVTAVIIAVAEPAVILKTIDGGQHWKHVYENNTKGMFQDAMEFWNEKSGIVIGDPIDGKFFVARTFDGGSTWRANDLKGVPAADSGEAFFAASGTNVRSLDKDEACFVSGGKNSRFFWKGKPISLPFTKGKETAGANSIAVRDSDKRKGSKYFIVVGGDFGDETASNNNCFITRDAGKTWITPSTSPAGYRSCVEFISDNKVITCGTTGVDYSVDGGENWTLLTKEGFHVCRKAKEGSVIFLAGSGKIGKLEL